jgi:hypothetical protein
MIDVQCFSQQQNNQFDVWMLHAVVANDLCTDDSFVVSFGEIQMLLIFSTQVIKIVFYLYAMTAIAVCLHVP